MSTEASWAWGFLTHPSEPTNSELNQVVFPQPLHISSSFLCSSLFSHGCASVVFYQLRILNFSKCLQNSQEFSRTSQNPGLVIYVDLGTSVLTHTHSLVNGPPTAALLLDSLIVTSLFPGRDGFRCPRFHPWACWVWHQGRAEPKAPLDPPAAGRGRSTPSPAEEPQVSRTTFQKASVPSHQGILRREAGKQTPGNVRAPEEGAGVTGKAGTQGSGQDLMALSRPVCLPPSPRAPLPHLG